MHEWSHVDRVWLLDYGGEQPQQLHHSVTGEHVELEGSHVLHFDGVVGFVEPVGEGGGDAIWANDLLECSMHGEVDGDRTQAAVFSRSEKTTTPFTDFAIGLRCQAVYHQCPLGTLSLEAYIFKVPAEHVGLCYFWTAPRIQDFVLGPTSGCKWPCRNFSKWVGLLGQPRNTNLHSGVLMLVGVGSC